MRDHQLNYDVLVQAICHRRYHNREIAEALGGSHARVVAAIRELKRQGGFPLDQAMIDSDDAVAVSEDRIADHLREHTSSWSG